MWKAISLSFLVTAGCTSLPTKPEFEASKVVERQDDASETPKWAKSETPMSESGGNVMFTSQMTFGGNARTEACFKGAELEARASILRQIKENLTASGQLNETDATSDAGVESLTAFLSQGSLSGVKTVHRYYEKREESNADSGERSIKLHCSVQISIKKSDLERQLQAAIGGGGNKQIHDKLVEAQQQFIESVGQKDADKLAH